MQRYNWSCHFCGISNTTGADACASCGFPAAASGRAILAARAAREPAQQAAVVRVKPDDGLFDHLSSLSGGERIVAWLLVVIAVAAGAVLKLMPSFVATVVALVVVLVCIGLIGLLVSSKDGRASG